jgi:hypothetical protein
MTPSAPSRTFGRRRRALVAESPAALDAGKAAVSVDTSRSPCSLGGRRAKGRRAARTLGSQDNLLSYSLSSAETRTKSFKTARMW